MKSLILCFGTVFLASDDLRPEPRTLYPTIKAERTAAPTTVELMAFPARSCSSRCLSLVSKSLSNGRPCRESASRPQSGPPRVVIYGMPQGVMQPTIPYARVSVSRSRPCERSMHLLHTVRRDVVQIIDIQDWKGALTLCSSCRIHSHQACAESSHRWYPKPSQAEISHTSARRNQAFEKFHPLETD